MSGTILLVHDDIAAIATVRRLLSRAGHEVVLATSAADALIGYGAHLPALVILAPGVEGGRGEVVLEELSQHPQGAQARVMLLGSQIADYVAPVVPLPLDGSTFLEMVERALSGGEEWHVSERRAEDATAVGIPAGEGWRATAPPEVESGLASTLFGDLPSLQTGEWQLATAEDATQQVTRPALDTRELVQSAIADAERELEAQTIAKLRGDGEATDAEKTSLEIRAAESLGASESSEGPSLEIRPAGAGHELPEATELHIHTAGVLDAPEAPRTAGLAEDEREAMEKKLRFEVARTQRALELVDRLQERNENETARAERAEEAIAELKTALEQLRAREQTVELERNAFKSQLEALNRSSSGWRSHAEEVEADRARLRARLVAAEEARTKLQEALAQAGAGKSGTATSAELEALRQQGAELTGRANAAEAELAKREKELLARAEAAEEELARREKELLAQAEAAEAELVRREQELLARAEAAEAELARRKTSDSDRVADAEASRSDLARELAEATARAEAAEAERAAESARLGQAETETAALERELSELSAQAETEKAALRARAEAAEAAKAALERQVAALGARAGAADAERGAESARLAEAEAERAALEQQLSAFADRAESAEAGLAAESARSRQLEAEKLALEQQLAAFADRAESTETGLAAESARSQQLEAEKLALEQEVSAQAARAEAAESAFGAEAAQREQAEAEKLALEQEVSAQAARAEAAETALTAETAQREQLEAELSAQAARAEAAEAEVARRSASESEQLAQAESARADFEAEAAALASRAETAETALTAESARAAQLEVVKAALEQERAELTARVERTETAKTALEQRVTALTSRAEQAEAELTSVSQRLAHSESIAAGVERQRVELAARLEETEAELSSSRTAHQALQTEHTELTAERDSLRAELSAAQKTLEEERGESAKTAAGLRDQVSKLEAALIETRAQAEQLTASVAEWQAHAEKLDTERNVLGQRAAATEQKRAEAQAAHEQAEAERSRLQGALQSIELKLVEAQARAMKLDGALSARRQEWQAELLVLRKQFEELEASLAAEQGRAKGLEAELATARESIRAEEEAKARLEAERAKAAGEAEQAQAEARRLAAEIESAVVPLLGPKSENWSVATSGTVGLIELARLVRRLAIAQAETRLELKAAGGLRVLWLRGGRLVAAVSDRDEESLIERARRDGLIDLRQARELKLLGASEPALLAAMRERGLLREAEVVPLCQRHVEQLALDALSEPETVYRIAKSPAPPPDALPVQALRGVPSLLAEALRRGLTAVDVTAELLRSVPRLLSPEASLVEAGFTEKERALLLAADGKATVQTLLLAAGQRAEPGARLIELARALELLELTPPSPDEVLDAPAELEVQRLAAKYETAVDADYFSVLGLQRSAGAAEVERAYQTLREEFHPLRFAGHPDTRLRLKAEQLQSLFAEAAHALGDERLRAEYARNLAE